MGIWRRKAKTDGKNVKKGYAVGDPPGKEKVFQKREKPANEGQPKMRPAERRR